MKKHFHAVVCLFAVIFMMSSFVSCQKGEEDAALSSIFVSTLPTKMNYAYDEPLDLSGLVVNAKYSDGSQKTIDGWTSMPKPWSKLNASGTVTVTITYEEKTTSFPVIVAAEGEEVPTEQKENIYATGATAASVIAGLGEDGDNYVHITGTVTSDDLAAISAAVKAQTVGVSLDFSDANFTTIPKNAFKDCKRLTGIVIPACVTSIGNFAFNGCTGLKSLELEDGEQELTLGINEYYSYGDGKGLFRDCPIEELYLGRNLNYIDYSDTRTDVSFNHYGYSAFGNIQSSSFAVTIGPKVTKTQAYSFYGCVGLSKVTINSDITSIGSNAFKGCTILESIEIPETVTTIGNSAFANCKKLKAITIPASVTSIGNYAFNGCTGLKTLELEDGEEELTLGINEYYSYGDGKGLFRDCPIEELHLGRNLKYIDYSDTSTDTAYNHYGYSAFANLQSTSFSVEIGSKVLKIQAYSFYGCAGLSKVTIKSDITSIASNAFKGCTILAELEIPETVTTIGVNAFANCKKLKKITIPKNINEIGAGAFNGCTGLKILTLDSGEKTLTLGINEYYSYGDGKGLFRDCPIENLFLGRNIEYEYNDKSSDTSFNHNGYSAFANISTLTTVTINVPKGLTSFTIGKYAFKGCTGINSATFTTAEGETWEWFTSSLGSTTSSGTTVDVSTTSAAASVLKNLGENYLHGKLLEVVTIEVQAPDVTL